jgi:hypothetical protein
MPYLSTSAVPSSRRICHLEQGVRKKVQASSNTTVRNLKRNQLYGNWKKNGATPAPQRTFWRSGSRVSALIDKGCNRAPTDNWFQDVIVVGKDQWSYRPMGATSHAFSRLDVGGGAVKDGTRNSLARIPLRWMVRECFLAGTGIMFNGQLLARIGLDPGTLYPRVLRRPDPVTFERADRSRIASDHSSGMVTIVNQEMVLTEEEEDLADILSPINDELERSKFWWFLEVLPLKERYQRKDGTWGWRTRCGYLHHIAKSVRTPDSPPPSFQVQSGQRQIHSRW